MSDIGEWYRGIAIMEVLNKLTNTRKERDDLLREVDRLAKLESNITKVLDDQGVDYE